MEAALGDYLNDFAVCYLDDILIYSDDPKQHIQQVRKVLQKLQDYGLYCKTSKCEFSVREVGFLGFIVSTEGVAIEPDRIAAFKDWSTPRSVRDIQVLISFTNFYQRFIQRYLKITAPITELLKGHQ
jgi:chromosomal replication initiation ATPase DnaA